MRICVIGSSRFPVREPFAGGLEAHTHALVRELSRRGHEVTLFAAPGSDASLPVRHLDCAEFVPSAASRADVGDLPHDFLSEHHAYLSLMLDLAADRGALFDVVHNNSLHHLPIAMARMVAAPMVTTLHTPPLGMLESAIALAAPGLRFVAVSEATAKAWAPCVASTTIHNGVDVDAWTPGPGGGPAVWSGRLVPEKAPHHAIMAARRAGLPLLLAGPLWDRDYFANEVEPRLGGGVAYVGHLSHRELRSLLRKASVAMVTPTWDEPYGLVAAEAMACGTPVAAYARGALPELVDDAVGALAAPDDVEELALAMVRASACDRVKVRRHAVREHSLTVMVDRYESTYRELLQVAG